MDGLIWPLPLRWRIGDGGTRVLQLIAAIFFGLTILAGLLLGSLFAGQAGSQLANAPFVLALINGVVFLVVGLLLVRFVNPRFGQKGVIFSLAAGFFVSILWPVALIALAMTGILDDLSADPQSVTVTIPAEQQ